MFNGDIVTLRSVELSDLDSIMEHWNNLKLRQYLYFFLPMSREEEKDWIQNTWKRRQEGTDFIFAIEHKETKEFLGTCGLSGLNYINQKAELGIAIHAEKNWGKGYGTDAMKVLMKFGFNYLNLHRIELRVFTHNTRAIKIYQKVGFKEIGIRREARFQNGKFHDVKLMDILRREWKDNVEF